MAIRQASARYYWTHKTEVLARRKRRRRLAVKVNLTWRRPSEAQWLEIERAYKVAHHEHSGITFRKLSFMYKISPHAIQRRSSASGGWALRATTDRNPASKRPGRAR